MNVPDTVGAPLIVIVLPVNVADTPVGNPVAVPIPVAPVIVWVIGVNAVLIHSVGALEAAVTVLLAFTIILPVANTVLQPPVNGML